MLVLTFENFNNGVKWLSARIFVDKSFDFKILKFKLISAISILSAPMFPFAFNSIVALFELEIRIVPESASTNSVTITHFLFQLFWVNLFNIVSPNLIWSLIEELFALFSLKNIAFSSLNPCWGSNFLSSKSASCPGYFSCNLS